MCFGWRSCFSVLTVALSMLTMVMLSGLASADDASNAAASTNATISSKTGTGAGVQQNLVNPVINGSNPMTTFDGSVSFNPQMQCPNSKAFLTVLVHAMPSGDLDVLAISQDMNYDGTPEYTYQVPPAVAVSGVCANGFISCDPGAWTKGGGNCGFYAWQADPTAHVTAVQLPDISQLGGCYCINASCGNQLALQNLPIVLQSIGGGIAGVIQARDSRYTISSYNIDGAMISFAGQASGSCTASLAGSTGSVNPQTYYGNAAALQNDAQNMANSQANDPTTLYGLVLSMPNSALSTAPCNITRSMVCDTETTQDLAHAGYTEVISDGCQTFDANAGCNLLSETIDGVVTYSNYNPTGLLPIQSCQNITVQRTAHCDAVGVPACPPSVNYTCTIGNYPCYSGVCAMLVPHSECRQWWQKKRVYSCTASNWDFSNIKKRVTSVYKTTQDNTTSVSYTDMRMNNDNSWTTEGDTVGLNSRTSHGSCVIACKTKIQVTSGQAGPAGDTATMRTTTASFNYYYHECDSAGNCPMSSGETPVIPCQCINEFADSFSAMQALRMGGQDMTCSDGVPKKLK